MNTAIKQGIRFQDLGIDHFEEPIPQYDLSGVKEIVDQLSVAISTGEQDEGRWRFKELIDILENLILEFVNKQQLLIN